MVRFKKDSNKFELKLCASSYLFNTSVLAFLQVINSEFRETENINLLEINYDHKSNLEI